MIMNAIRLGSGNLFVSKTFCPPLPPPLPSDLNNDQPLEASHWFSECMRFAVLLRNYYQFPTQTFSQSFLLKIFCLLVNELRLFSEHESWPTSWKNVIHFQYASAMRFKIAQASQGVSLSLKTSLATIGYYFGSVEETLCDVNTPGILPGMSLCRSSERSSKRKLINQSHLINDFTPAGKLTLKSL